MEWVYISVLQTSYSIFILKLINAYFFPQNNGSAFFFFFLITEDKVHLALCESHFQYCRPTMIDILQNSSIIEGCQLFGLFQICIWIDMLGNFLANDLIHLDLQAFLYNFAGGDNIFYCPGWRENSWVNVSILRFDWKGKIQPP